MPVEGSVGSPKACGTRRGAPLGLVVLIDAALVEHALAGALRTGEASDTVRLGGGCLFPGTSPTEVLGRGIRTWRSPAAPPFIGMLPVLTWPRPHCAGQDQETRE